MTVRNYALIAALFCTAAIPYHASSQTQSSAVALDAFYAAEWEYGLSHSPEFATYVGDARFNDRLGDYSAAEIKRGAEHDAEALARLQAIPAVNLTEQQTISRRMMLRQLQMSIDSYRLKEWEMPVSQMNGVHLDLPGGPIISQSVPEPNQIQNIDPTAMVDDDGRVYLYWGTFGQLRGIELQPDMVTPKGHAITVKTLDGFFEAPWLMKRNGMYYMIYAGNKAGPASPCTPAVYHACIAYGTSASPLGPWTYRGVILARVSFTTSHPGAIEFKGKWYLVYHTADAKNGGHFRRSVAIDEM